jgi:hypothetical protein
MECQIIEGRMISIGCVYRGPELEGSYTFRVLGALMNAAIDCRGSFEVGKSPGINVVFYVPGSLGAPDWEGIRDAKFSPKRQYLMVQVAVPEELVNSPGLTDFAIESLRGANAVAFEFFRVRGLEFPLREAEELVDQITERVRTSEKPK